MNQKIKKLSIVVYCNNNFEETKETLYSIIDQNLSHLFYEVLILNDDGNKNFTTKLNNFIKSQELTNYHVFTFAFYTGLPLTFNFLLKNNIIKTTYVTIVKSGDTLKDKWLSYFLEELYPMKYDAYFSDLKDELTTIQDEIDADTGKKSTVSKSRMIISSTPSGVLSKEEAVCTKPIFLGKIWKTSIIKHIRLDDNKILYQDIFMYMQMVFFAKTFWYESRYTGTVRRKSWLPKKMDSKRIELLSLTLNKMISRNPYLNGHILQLLSLALHRTADADKKQYHLSNYKYLKDNFEIIPIYEFSKRKVKKMTKSFVEIGEIK